MLPVASIGLRTSAYRPTQQTGNYTRRCYTGGQLYFKRLCGLRALATSYGTHAGFDLLRSNKAASCLLLASSQRLCADEIPFTNFFLCRLAPGYVLATQVQLASACDYGACCNCMWL